MSGDGLEKTVIDLLAIKDKHSLDNDKFLLLLGLVNLMSIIDLLEARNAGGGQGARTSRHQEMVPFLGMFSGPKNRVAAEGVLK